MSVDDTHGGAVPQAPDVAFLTPKDLQNQLQISERLTYKLLRSQAIPNIRVAGMYRIRRQNRRSRPSSVSLQAGQEPLHAAWVQGWDDKSG
jgi:hypothetical protein